MPPPPPPPPPPPRIYSQSQPGQRQASYSSNPPPLQSEESRAPLPPPRPSSSAVRTQQYPVPPNAPPNRASAPVAAPFQPSQPVTAARPAVQTAATPHYEYAQSAAEPSTPTANIGISQRKPTPEASHSFASFASPGSSYAGGGATTPSSSYYGGSSYSATASTTSIRTTPGIVSYSSPYVLPPSSYGTPAAIKPNNANNSRSMLQNHNKTYQHNALASLFLVPTLASILWWHESAILLQIFLLVVLVLYGLDLSNFRDGLVVAMWAAAFFMTMLSGFGNLLQVEDADANGPTMILQLLKLAVEGILFCCVACWGTLQFQWLYKDVPTIAIGMERTLHSVLPPTTACIGTFHAVRVLSDYWGLDRVATLMPHLFAALLALGMLILGTSPSSFRVDPGIDNDQKGKFTRNNPADPAANDASSNSSITSSVARFHSMLLLLVPGIVHVMMFRRRILSKNAATDDIYDLILVWTVPYMLHFGLIQLSTKTSVSDDDEDDTSPTFATTESPYAMKRNSLFPQGSTLRGALVPMVVSLVGSWALQQRYLIPLCHSISYQFNGHGMPSTLMVSVYLTSCTLALYFGAWISGRLSSVTNEPLFGAYHEDIVQLSMSSAGLLLGKAFGMPWSLTPLPILAFLGLSVWFATRMLRYLSIFLFVVHAAGVVVFSYRFAIIDETIALAVPFSLEVSLVRFGMTLVVTSVVIGLVAGLAVRPAGGVGASIMKYIDVGGILGCVYALLLTVLELTLLKRPVPSKELAGQDLDMSGSDLWQDEDYMYDHATALLTSCLLLAVAMFSRRQKLMSSKAAMCLAALSLGKAVAIVTDASDMDNKIRSEAKQERKATQIFCRAIVTALLLMVMLGPRAILSPIYIKKSGRSKRPGPNMTIATTIPGYVHRMIIVYAVFILPITLIATVSYVLTPLIMAFSAHYGGGAYYSVAPPISEMIGCALALWGIGCLLMLSHLFPDGGGETWKKATALTLLMGAGIGLSAPSVPEWIRGTVETGVSNPYASISSVGSQLTSQGVSKTGGWGILLASLATLLAVTGPLELRERRSPTGKKDKTMLLRMMLFSLMFGSGVSWFITMQSMSQASVPILIATGFGAMAISFFGTVTGVLAYFLELDNFDEVDQVSKIWAVIFIVFMFVISAPHVLVKTLDEPMFGVGGWLSTYLIVGSFVSFSIGCALRVRPGRDKASRRLGNFNTALSWVVANIVLYGGYGVAGLDRTFDVTTIFGVPVSIVGTFLVSPILLILEGEVSSERRRTVQRVSTTSKAPIKTLGFTIENLRSSNQYALLVVGTSFILLLASIYAILLRGLFDGSALTSHKDILGKLFSSSDPDSLAVLAEKTMSHSKALEISAKLAGSSIWTADNIFGPLLHLGGLAATLPTLMLFVLQLWSGKPTPLAQVSMCLPLTLIPLVVCRGVPSLRALGLVGLIGGAVQVISSKVKNQSQVRL